jgi:hypothetical protein
MTRDELLALSAEELLRQCRCDTFRGVGPGGQKRNKTESAVRVTLVAEQLSAFDDTSRSQHENKLHALSKLRRQIALQLRAEPRSWTGEVPSLCNAAREQWVAVAIDALESTGYRLAEAAAILGSSTSRLSKELGKDPQVWQFVNSARTARELPPLRLK